MVMDSDLLRKEFDPHVFKMRTLVRHSSPYSQMLLTTTECLGCACGIFFLWWPEPYVSGEIIRISRVYAFPLEQRPIYIKSIWTTAFGESPCMAFPSGLGILSPVLVRVQWKQSRTRASTSFLTLSHRRSSDRMLNVASFSRRPMVPRWEVTMTFSWSYRSSTGILILPSFFQSPSCVWSSRFWLGGSCCCCEWRIE